MDMLVQKYPLHPIYLFMTKFKIVLLALLVTVYSARGQGLVK